MKLKKIASLALAGVMAVSMLAGCATKAPVEETPVVTVGVSSEIGAKVEGVPEYVTFADSTKLDSALKAAVEYAGVGEVLDQYLHSNTLQDCYPVADQLAIDTNANVYTIGSFAALANAEYSTEDGYTVADATATRVFAVSSAIGENAVKQMIAEELESYVPGYLYSVGGNFNYNYTVSVSTCTKTVNSSAVAENPTVTFVAIQVVRTAAHQ